MILFPIPAIFIIMILIAIFGGIEAIDDFFSMNTLKSIMEAVPMIVALILIAVCIKISFDNLEEKEGWEGLSKVYKVLLVAFLPIGAIIYYELYSMDVNKNCFGWLGKYVPSPLLALLVNNYCAVRYHQSYKGVVDYISLLCVSSDRHCRCLSCQCECVHK